ncbi:HdeD family acid-resistance protein [Rhodopseudomonas sp. HC1]|uniref:HdeD family acid-resistance protein n=1 Tax=Rhodopseudomonas infernalis TaxID=2897386 RepID=UPI001EE7B263|nr:HdeD family acid-resistance protein [Rhodopseudomonas infernalis]MCG6203596.1 HdeD family acid-resistance protein [Rhodopseudomonas infernalis]
MTFSNDTERLQAAVEDNIQKHWKAYLIEGILLLILGFGAILLPLLASLTIAILLGWMFLISGVAGLVFSFWARKAPGFWWSLISAILAVVAGVVLITQPVQGILTLTIVIGVYFLAEGVATIMYALQHRGRLSERWGWMLAAGVLDILVAFIIISGWPGTAAWAIGLLVGINLVFGGTSLIAMALAARNKA